jgi:hypothetical protein
MIVEIYENGKRIGYTEAYEFHKPHAMINAETKEESDHAFIIALGIFIVFCGCVGLIMAFFNSMKG